MKDTGAFVYVVDDDASAGDSSLTRQPLAVSKTKNSHHESGGGTMDLKESKFYYAGHDMNFAVFSDYPCRVKYVDSIRLPIDLAPVEIYTIEPASNGQWVVVEQWNESESSLKLFLREGEVFRENQSHNLPLHLKEQIMQRVPKSPWTSEPSWAA